MRLLSSFNLYLLLLTTVLQFMKPRSTLNLPLLNLIGYVLGNFQAVFAESKFLFSFSEKLSALSFSSVSYFRSPIY